MHNIVLDPKGENLTIFLNEIKQDEDIVMLI